MSIQKFKETIAKGYNFKGKFITLGSAIYNNETQTNSFVNVPLETMNRHGLIAGATGTGKTKTLQVLAEHLSENGVPVLLMDIKGDLSGLAAKSAGHKKIDERHEAIGLPFSAKNFPVELLTISEQNGVRLRATISEFGPVLISRILQVTETQAGIISVIFKYCDDNNLPLLDLDDLKKLLAFATNEGKQEFENSYGRISKASTGAILRKIIELEQQGANLFFGETSFNTNDLLKKDSNGKAFINILRLNDIQEKPKLFSTFMLSLLAEIYASFPEVGDLEQPKLVLFIDEAHLIFKKAPDILIDQIEIMVKLIRSKGIGLYFVTQNPTDIPEAILGQLGLKIQHALRAFTAKDRKAIKLAAENYPESEFYDTSKELTSLGIGEALVSVLNEEGAPTPLAATMLRAPMSRMDILSPEEINSVINNSELYPKYSTTINRDSAYEMLNRKLKIAQEEQALKNAKKEREELENAQKRKSITKRSTRTKQNPLIKVLTSPTVIRSVLGILNKFIK